MKLCNERTGRGLVILAIVWRGGLCAMGQDASMPIENLRLPIDHFADGTIKTQLTAAFALIPPTGAVLASNVVVELFHPDASVDVVVHAEQCRYDRQAKQIDSESAIRIERSGIVISGVGFEWHADKERVIILSEARVVFKRELNPTSEFLESGRKEEPSQ